MNEIHTIAELTEIYHDWGAHRYDEAVTQLDHALQCATLAQHAGAPASLITAALLHDLGHLIAMRDANSAEVESTDRHHENIGADALGSLFSAEVTNPIRLHVTAKRALVVLEPAYRMELSPGSQASLERQGGPLTHQELHEFMIRPGAHNAMLLRHWDDAGKVHDLRPHTWKDFLPTLAECARSN